MKALQSLLSAAFLHSCPSREAFRVARGRPISIAQSASMCSVLPLMADSI